MYRLLRKQKSSGEEKEYSARRATAPGPPDSRAHPQAGLPLFLRRRTAGEPEAAGAAVPPIVHEVLRSPGQRLDQSTLELMESRFGQDFSDVRVHTDARAAESAKAVNALAYTAGQSVVFGAGRYAPDTVNGRRVLAHELTHVLQQRVSDESSPLEIGSPDHPHEAEADAAAGGIESNLSQPAVSVSAASTTPGLQRMVESDEEDLPEEEMEAGAPLGSDESDADVPDTADPDFGAEEEEEETDVAQVSESAAAKTGGGAGTKPKKKKPAERRRRIHRTGNFSGRLTKIFCGKRGKYFRNCSWTWGKGEMKQEPSTQETRSVVLDLDDVGTIPPTGDSNITYHGAVFYKGEPITGTVELTQYESQAGISLPTPKPVLAWNEKGKITSVTKTAAGTLQFKFGDESDPASGPRGRIVVERQNVLGLWVTVYDTTWITTQGQWQTATLDSVLTPDADYRVRVFAERWGDGRTQVDYSLDLQEKAQSTVTITKTTPGKWNVTKEPHRFHLKF